MDVLGDRMQCMIDFLDLMYMHGVDVELSEGYVVDILGLVQTCLEGLRCDWQCIGLGRQITRRRPNL